MSIGLTVSQRKEETGLADFRALRNAPESWRDYLYWNLELDDDES